MKSTLFIFSYLKLSFLLSCGLSAVVDMMTDELLSPIAGEKELKPNELSEFRFAPVERDYIVQRVELRDLDEDQFITFDTRSGGETGSGDGIEMTTPPATTKIYLDERLWVLAAIVLGGLLLLACCICCPLILCLRRRRMKRGSFKLEQMKDNNDDLMFSKRLSVAVKWFDEGPSAGPDPFRATSFGKDEHTKPQVKKDKESKEKCDVDEEEKGKQQDDNDHNEVKKENASVQKSTTEEKEASSPLVSQDPVSDGHQHQDGKGAVKEKPSLAGSDEKLNKNAESKPPKTVTFKLEEDNTKPATSEAPTTTKLSKPSQNNDSENTSKTKTPSSSEADKEAASSSKSDASLPLKQSSATASSQPSQNASDDSLDMAALEAELRNVMEYMEIEEKKAKEAEAADNIANFVLDTEQATWL